MWLPFTRQAQFDGYYDKQRFYYIHEGLQKEAIVQYRGNSRIRKTACLYGPKYNVYIDTSDGVNADIPVLEYAARALSVVDDAAGKPFLYLKSVVSEEKSKQVRHIIESAGGTFRPFLFWHNNFEWYSKVLSRRQGLRKRQRSVSKQFDIGMAAGLEPLSYPKPDAVDNRVSWHDKELFDKGDGGDTGYFRFTTRLDIHNRFEGSRFRYDFSEKLPYQEYLKRSFGWKVVFCPPGIGDYSLRIFDHASLGQCIVMQETSYDFASSWRKGIAFIDFTTEGWEDALARVIDQHEEWGKRAENYFENYLTQEAIIGLLQEELEEFRLQVGRTNI